MARFTATLPDDILKEIGKRIEDTPQMMGEMTKAGAEVVYQNVIRNMKGSFKDSSKLEPYLKITKTYRTFSDDAVNTKVAFYGYYKPETKTFTKKGKGGQSYTYNGVPVPLIVMAREYGTSIGEDKAPFFRKSFRKNQIENAMKSVQDKYIKEGD